MTRGHSITPSDNGRLVREIRVGDEISINGRTARITQVCGPECAYAGFVGSDGTVEADMRIDEKAWREAYARQRGY